MNDLQRRLRETRYIRPVLVVSVLLALVVVPLYLPAYVQEVLFYPVGIYVLLALGLNIVVGRAGLLDLGYVAFFAVGAYVAALLGMRGWSIWATFPVAIAAAILLAVLVGPVLRLRGDYLAIVTLGLGEIIRITAQNLSVTGGARGLSPIPHPSDISLGPVHISFGLWPIPYYYVCLLLCCIVMLITLLIERSRIGRAWAAIRLDEDAAESMGVPTFWMKLCAFALGASVGSSAGVLYASKVSFISPTNFELIFSILVLCCLVIGGMGSNFGAILGAVVIASLPELFRDVAQYRILAYGIALVAFMILRPRGMWPRSDGWRSASLEPITPVRSESGRPSPSVDGGTA